MERSQKLKMHWRQKPESPRNVAVVVVVAKKEASLLLVVQWDVGSIEESPFRLNGSRFATLILLMPDALSHRRPFPF